MGSASTAKVAKNDASIPVNPTICYASHRFSFVPCGEDLDGLGDVERKKEDDERGVAKHRRAVIEGDAACGGCAADAVSPIDSGWCYILPTSPSSSRPVTALDIRGFKISSL